MKGPHPRFPSLAAAVRAGIQIVPDAAPPRRYFGVSPETARLGCDALAAAWFAEFYDLERGPDDDGGLGAYLSSPLRDAYPALAKDVGAACPLGPGSACPLPPGGRSLEAKVVHLEDEHRFSREEVADWLAEGGY